MRKVLLGMVLALATFGLTGCSEVYEYEDEVIAKPSRTLDDYEARVSVNQFNDQVFCHNCGLNGEDTELDIVGSNVQSIVQNRHVAVLHLTEQESPCVYGHIAVVFKRSQEAHWVNYELGECEPTNVEAVREEAGKIIVTAKNDRNEDRTYIFGVKYK